MEQESAGGAAVEQESSGGAGEQQWSRRAPVEQESSSGAGERRWSRRAPVEQQESSGGAGERRWSSSGAGEQQWSRRAPVEVSGGGGKLQGRGEEECIMQFRSIILIRVVREKSGKIFGYGKVSEKSGNFVMNAHDTFLAVTKQLLRTLIFRLSVCHTFLTMFRSWFHPEIFRSYYHWQTWCPCKRSIVKVTEVMTPFNHFQTITQVWIHIWRWNEAWFCLEEVPYCFSRSSVNRVLHYGSSAHQIQPNLSFGQVEVTTWLSSFKYQYTRKFLYQPRKWLFGQPARKLSVDPWSNFKVTRLKKIVDFDPIWAFPDCNSSSNSPMAMKWCSKRCSTEEVHYCFSRSSIKFQGHVGQKNRQFLPELSVSGL